MARYLIQIDPVKKEAILAGMRAVSKVTVVTQVFDYLAVDIPPEALPKVKAIPGVITITPDKPATALYTPIPVNIKLSQFIKLFQSNPITGPAMALKFAIEADMGKRRIPTSESRRLVGADIAEAEGVGGKGVKVAVLDTGTTYDLLFQGPYLGGRSSVEGEPIPWDQVGHGVHVQTTISGRPYSSIHGFLKGVAVDAQVAAFKVLGYGIGAGTTSSILRGIADAVEWGADIVNMSLGGPEEDPGNPEDRIISALTKEGMIFVCAAGNEGDQPRTIATPGASEAALTVGAVSIDGKIALFSSRGQTKDGRVKPDVVAPGVDILSTSAGYIAAMQFMDGPPSLAAISGTSMATPHVAGVVALALQYARSKGKSLNTYMIKEAMSKYGSYPGTSKNNNYGWGLITYPILQRFIDEL